MYAVVLTHQSALTYWKSQYRLDARSEVAYAKRVIKIAPKLNQLKVVLSCDIKNPLHVLVADKNLRRCNNVCVSHVWKHPLPKGSVVDSGRGFYVISPELCFVVMARYLSFAELVEFGFYLCGSYVGIGEKIYSCRPLTTKNQIKDCIEKNRKVAGAGKAEDALKYVLENSASPMETKLAMLLCLPPKRGGYGFVAPTLNYQIDKQANKWGTTFANYYKCDLTWPEARVALEYDSNLYHTGADHLASDSIRRTELINLGYTVISVASPQVTTTMGTKNLANALAKQMNRRMRLFEPRFSEAHAKLRRELF